MAEETKSIQVQETEKQEIEESGAERTRERRAYVPRADIYETDEAMVILADMPGVDENTVDITLEQGVLTLNGYVEETSFENYTLAYAEYGVGDYVRRFTIPSEIDEDNIQATLKDGVLRLELPKAKPETRKITVQPS
ncbi:MAG: Hsp20/alpha crystallin family protein [Anaerolineae bacterium]